MKANYKNVAFFISLMIMVVSCEEDLFFDDPRDALTGEWVVNEDSEIFRKKDMNRIYRVNISKDPFDSTAIFVRNFYELNGRVKIHVDGLNLDIPDQAIEGFTIEEGSGSVSSNHSKITLYYYVSFTGERDVVRADYTRPESR